MDCDILIVGAGAAGLFCAGSIAGAGTGARVVVIDHARAAGEKIRISGGGRCNFTNLATARDRFLSENPRFAASALAGFSPRDFVALVDGAGIGWHEKTLGQLFCDGRATQITDLLIRRMRGADLWLETSLQSLERGADGFTAQTSRGVVRARAVVVASGGKSIPKMGASGLAYDLARQFGLSLHETRPGLVPLTFAEQELALTKPLAGVSVEAEISHGKTRFRDALLFTHRGLSGPAVLQISSFWRPGEEITVDLAPGADLGRALRDRRGQGGRVGVPTVLGGHLPARLAEAIAAELGLSGARLADLNNAALDRISARVHRWKIRPVGSEGYRTAEVTVGGIDTRGIDAKTMQARDVPGLYFIGECLDVTGWLGGYNFQWAWASGHAAGLSLAGVLR
ncbi:MAG: NAD(P)/FAD-dependent oxidoreductase [Paracoccus sp. (in: a-proteobacteria)]|nr:NAD(P)/FAD-dependent oxidoreductase [Paracoccus sp. (in: a-proteobacteria)]